MNDFFNAIKNNERIGPRVLMLSPTDHCNLSCKICWRLKEAVKFNQPSFNFLKKIIVEAKELNVETIDLIGGGEPFLRKDILKLMGLVKSLGMKGTITTNSILIKEDDINTIIKMGWDEINFSLDGSTPEINDYIRGRDVFKKVLLKIETFQRIKRKYNRSKPIIRLSFTITRTNVNDISNYIKLAKKLGIQNINFSTLFEWNSNKQFWLSFDKKSVNQIFKKGLRLAKKLDIKTNLEAITFGNWKHELPKFCFAPWYMLFINASKEAMLCCTLASLYQNNLGKVNNLKDIWYGKKMEKLRENMKNGTFFKECKMCLPEFTEMFNRIYGEMNDGT